ncbi:MAG: hypothetical protein ACLQVY_09435 [Limisphaerales bacterium]
MNDEANQQSLTPMGDFEALKLIIDCLKPLDDDEKIRLLKSAITFLRLDLWFGGPRSTLAQPSFTPTSSDQPISDFSTRTEMSPKQFLNEKRPANDIERIACLAYYLTHFRNLAEFKTLDLSKLNTEAAQPKFSNPAVPVQNATQRNFLVATSGGNKQLGAIGEQFVQALPDRDAAKAVLERVRIRKSRKKRNEDSTDDSESTGN